MSFQHIMSCNFLQFDRFNPQRINVILTELCCYVSNSGYSHAVPLNHESQVLIAGLSFTTVAAFQGNNTTMSAPLARYESFLINNVSTISTLESSLRSVTWFLPGRFKDAELASEAR